MALDGGTLAAEVEPPFFCHYGPLWIGVHIETDCSWEHVLIIFRNTPSLYLLGSPKAVAVDRGTGFLRGGWKFGGEGQGSRGRKRTVLVRPAVDLCLLCGDGESGGV